MTLDPGIIALAASIALMALALAVAQGTQWLRAKSKNAYVNGVLDRIDDAALVGVRFVQQTLVDTLKAENANGRLTVAQAEEAMREAYRVTLEQLGKEGVDAARKLFGVDQVEAQLKQRLEALVAQERS